MLLFSIPVFSQQINITGRIVDKINVAPVEFAYVVLMDLDSVLITGCTSDINGDFIISKVTVGDYILSVSSIGYETSATQIKKTEGNINLEKIELQPSSIQLSEITIKAQSVINKTDRKLITPSLEQVKASVNGIDLLQKLNLPRVSIDLINNRIIAAGNGEIQLRLNGVEVTNAEIVSLQPNEIIRVEFHDQPGARYGNAVAVIDFITRRNESGGNINGNAMHVISGPTFTNDYLSAKYNHKKSEFAANVYWMGRDMDWTRKNDEILRFTDNEIHRIEQGIPTKFKNDDVNTTFNYNILEKDRCFFNARIRYNFQDHPNSYTDRRSTLITSVNPEPMEIYDHESMKNHIPALDLYYQQHLKNKQLLIFNVVGTYINSSSSRLYQEYQEDIPLTDIYSHISGDKYSLITEAIYEKSFENSKFTGGLKHNQSYTHNVYSGNTKADVGMNMAETYGYAEYLWKKGKFTSVANIGVMRTYYSQDNSKQDKYTFRPSISLAYNINEYTFLRARGYIWGANPSLADLNNVEQAIDSLQIRRGNPYLKSYYDYGGNITFGYNKGIVGIDLRSEYKYLDRPVMESIFQEGNKFIHTPENQKKYQRFNTEATFRLRLFKEHLSIALSPGINHYISTGNNYKHTYTNVYTRVNIDAMYKKWILNFWATTAENWFYGETMNQGEAFQMLSFGYNGGAYSIMLGAMNPLGTDYKTRNENRSYPATSTSQLIGDDLTPMVFLKASFNINFGRQYSGSNRRLNNSDTDAGIMSGAKK
jgi:hypothetical protein